MASPSRKTCLQCKASATDSFRNGWRLRSGEFAQLCHRCGSAYEKGVFCEVFHSNDGGWRDCEACGKVVHCGCIVSFNTYLPVDFGGIMCNDCSRISLILARNDGSFHERSVLLDDPQRGPATKNRRELRYHPHVSAASELHQTCVNPNSNDPPVYEKKLSDNDLKLSRLVLPSKFAEALFPELQGQHLMPVSVLDTDGKQWEFFFCCCSNPTNTMYVLDGLRDYVIAQKCQPGDTVSFCKTKPGGKVMMGLRKTSVASST